MHIVQYKLSNPTGSQDLIRKIFQYDPWEVYPSGDTVTVTWKGENDEQQFFTDQIKSFCLPAGLHGVSHS